MNVKKALFVALLVSLLVLPVSFERIASAQGDLNVAVVVLKKGRVGKRVWKSAKQALTKHFASREGFKLIGTNTLRRLIRRHKLAFFSYTKKEQFIAAGKKLKADLLVVALLSAKKRRNYNLDFWFVDVKHGSLIRYLSTECPGCSNAVLIGGIGQLVAELVKPPYKLYLNTVPQGATVTEKGKEIGKTPLAEKITPGNHTIRIALEGYETIEVEFSMPDDRPVDAEIELTKKETQPAAAVAAGAAAQQQTNAPTKTQTQQPKANEQAAQPAKPQAEATKPKPKPEPVAKEEPKPKEEPKKEPQVPQQEVGQPVASAEQPPSEPETNQPQTYSDDYVDEQTEVAASASKQQELPVMQRLGLGLVWSGALLAGGGALLTVAGLKFDDLADEDEDVFPTQSQDERDMATRLKTISYAVYGTSAVAIITGIILYFTYDAPEDSSSVYLTPAVGNGFFGANATVRW